MPDWRVIKHPWLYDLEIPAGFSFGPATVFETTLPDHSFPVSQRVSIRYAPSSLTPGPASRSDPPR